jgi:hypothetical protein
MMIFLKVGDFTSNDRRAVTNVLQRLGIEGFVHLAAPLGGILDLEFALNMGKGAGINALKACAKNPSVKRFVNTSSSTAASLSKPDIGHEIFMDTNTYNDEAYEQAKAEQGRAKGFLIYAAMKTETERAMWQWVKENNPDFVMNTIVRIPHQVLEVLIADMRQLPNVNFGAVLVPEHQGYPSTIDWAHGAWTGENLEVYAKMVDPQWFVSILDSALLHIAALIYSEVNSERLFGYTERWNFNDLLAIYRKHYPERKFAQDFDGLGRDWVIPPTDRAEEVLKWVKGSGWDGLEESVVAMSKNW